MIVKVFSVSYLDLGCVASNIEGVRHRLEQKYPEVGWNREFFLHDCSDIETKNAAKAKCIGEHIQNLRNLVGYDDANKRKFDKDLACVLNLADVHFESHQEPYCVVGACPQGRHRSVAWATCMAAAIAKRGNYEVQHPTHLSRETWYKGQCSSCWGCDPRCPDKAKLFEQYV